MTGNESYDKDAWDADTWAARFIVKETIEISRDVAIYASCSGNHSDTLTPSTEADMTDDLTTFEGEKCQIFKITNGAKVTIANLRIVRAYGYYGGAIGALESSDVLIKNCWITGNGCYDYGNQSMGTGIYANASKITVQSCDISNNMNSANHGGGIAIENGAYALITNSTITSNDTVNGNNRGNGGGIAVMKNSSADIVNCVISKNKASYGGGIYVSNSGSSGTNANSVTITNCTITDNFCGYNHNGGGIYMEEIFGNCYGLHNLG